MFVRRSLVYICVLLMTICLHSPAAAQSLERTDRGYVWRHGKEYIRYNRGKWSAGIEGKTEFSWHMFLWHDNWIYETLPGGNVETSPAFTDDGSLAMRGTLSAREGSPPVKYALRITSVDEGLRVRCELEKSAALKLTRGIWLHLSGSRDKFQGTERVWFAPSAHGTVSATPSAPANRVLLELDERRSLCLGLPAYRLVENEGSTRAHAFRINLLPNDFGVGETVVLECTPSKRPGFVRTSTVDPLYLAFDSGDGFFAIGHNLPIYHTTGQLGDEAMRKFAAAGENFNRWWMSSRGFGIEWTDRLGWYRQDVAARIDHTLELAAELGLFYMMCMDTHQDFREAGWERNPFNVRNGGPCQTPSDWFIDEAAKRYYKKRLRYTVARWGYSPNVLCWEFGNEMEGWAIHNSLWAGLTNFAAGGPMPWWHESYIDPLDLHFHFTSLSRFTQDLPLGSERWATLDTEPPEFLDADRPPETRDIVIATASRWGKPEHSEFMIRRDGTVGQDRLPQQLLHGRSHRDIKNPPTFIVDYPKPGKFTVRVGRVSASGLLKIWVDDELKHERELPCAEGLGKSSVYRPQWKLWETTYEEDVSVDIPAGKHCIRVENFGRDWVGRNRPSAP